jgi:hypothetical protein
LNNLQEPRGVFDAILKNARLIAGFRKKLLGFAYLILFAQEASVRHA